MHISFRTISSKVGTVCVVYGFDISLIKKNFQFQQSYFFPIRVRLYFLLLINLEVIFSGATENHDIRLAINFSDDPVTITLEISFWCVW